MKNYSFTRVLLEEIAEIGELAIDALLPLHYPHARLTRNILGLGKKTPKPINKHSLSSMLWRLKKDGLIIQVKSSLAITKKGRKYLKEQKPRQYRDADELLPSRDGTYRLFMFDVPELKREKRIWLRRELIDLGFRMLHKSVFIGDRPLAQDFIKEIEYLGLSKYIHFITINKLGTLFNRVKS